MKKPSRTISGSMTPAKAKRRVDITPPIPPGVGATMHNGGSRTTHGDPPATLGMALRQPGRKSHPAVGPGKIPTLRASLRQ